MSTVCDRATFQRLVVAAVAYACGRASYLPSALCRYLTTNLGALDPETEREILAVIDERANLGPDALGWAIDRTVWADLVKTLRENLRHPKAGERPDTSDADMFWLMAGSALRHDKAQDSPELTADNYCALIEANADSIPAKWVANLMRDVTEAYGKNWIAESGPERDPEGFAALYRTLASIWERTQGPIPERLALDLPTPTTPKNR